MQTLTQLFTETVKNTDKDAIGFYILNDKRKAIGIRYSVLLERVHNVANHLMESGLKDTTILVACESSVDIIICSMACLFVGNTPVIMPYRKGTVSHEDFVTAAGFNKAQAILSLVKTGNIAGIRWIHAQKVQTKLAKTLHPASAKEDATIIFASHQEDNSLAYLPFQTSNLVQLCDIMAEKYDNKVYQKGTAFCYPTNTPFGYFMGFVFPMFARYECWLLGSGKEFVLPIAWLSLISNYQLSATIAPATLYQEAINKIDRSRISSLDLSSLRLALCSVTSDNLILYEAFSKHFYNAGFDSFSFNFMYTLPCAACFITANPLDRPVIKLHVKSTDLARGEVVAAECGDATSVFATLGKPLRDHRIIIAADDNLTERGPNQIGEVFIEGPSVSTGYLRNATLNSQCYLLHNKKFYYRPGGYGFLNPEGIFHYLGGREDVMVVDDNYIDINVLNTKLKSISPLLSEQYFVMFNDDTESNNALVMVLEIDTDNDEMIPSIQQLLGEVAYQYIPYPTVLLLICPESTLPEDNQGRVDVKKVKNLWKQDKLTIHKTIQLNTKIAHRDHTQNAMISLFGKSDEERSEILKTWLYAWIAMRQKVNESRIKGSDHLSHFGYKFSDCLCLAYDIYLIFNIWRSPIEIWTYPNLHNLALSLFGNKSEYTKYLDMPTHDYHGEKEHASYNEHLFYDLGMKYPGDTSLNHCQLYHFYGYLDEGAMIQSLKVILNHHQTLRSHYITEEDTLYRIINEDIEPHLTQMDLSSMPEREQDNMLTALLKTMHEEEIHLDKAPLWRALLVKLDDDSFGLAFAFHRIIADDWSTELVMRDLSQCYNAEAQGYPARFSRKHITYTDFQRWQANIIDDDWFKQQMNFWKAAVKDCVELPLPTDNLGLSSGSDLARAASFILEPELTRKLLHCSREHNTSLFVMLSSLFQVLLLWFTGESRITIRCNHINRHQRDTFTLMGNCEAEFLLSTKIIPRNSLQELITINMHKMFAIYQNCDVNLDQITSNLPAPLQEKVPNVAFEFYDFPMEYTFDNLEVKRQHGYFAPNHMVRDNIKLLTRIRLAGDEVHCEVHYLEDMFKHETILAFIDQFVDMTDYLFEHMHMPIHYVIGDAMYKKVD